MFKTIFFELSLIFEKLRLVVPARRQIRLHQTQGRGK